MFIKVREFTLTYILKFTVVCIILHIKSKPHFMAGILGLCLYSLMHSETCFLMLLFNDIDAFEVYLLDIL